MTNVIWQVRQFVDDQGHALQEFTDTVTGEVHYASHGVLSKRAGNRVHQLPFNFNIPAETVEEAFENFEGAARAAVPEAEKRLDQQITPALQRAPAYILDSKGQIMLPNGDPGGNGKRKRT